MRDRGKPIRGAQFRVYCAWRRDVSCSSTTLAKRGVTLKSGSGHFVRHLDLAKVCHIRRSRHVFYPKIQAVKPIVKLEAKKLM